MDEIVWEDPPEVAHGRKGGTGRWFRVLDECRQHPGKWMRLDGEHAEVGYKIRQGYVGGATAGEFEATTRDQDRLTRKCTLFVRYVGDQP
jgi:hypothetical protein